MSGLARTETDAPDAPCYTPTFKARRWMRQKRRFDVRYNAIEVLRQQPDGCWKLIVGDPNGRE